MDLSKISQLKKRLLFVVVILISGTISYSQSFDCNTSLFQVVNGHELMLLDPMTGTYSTVGTSSINYDGAGFNVNDGFIYGIGEGNVLVRVNNSGEATNLGHIKNFSSFSYSGDIAPDGKWYSFKKDAEGWIMNKIDVTSSKPEAKQDDVEELPGLAAAVNCGDISYNDLTEKFYGMTDGKLIKFDHKDKSVMVIADYSTESDAGAYSAAWSDGRGNNYFRNDVTGNVYRAAFDKDENILTFGFVFSSEPGGSSDGMSCPLSDNPVIPEICDNGVDDDGDGLADCEDPDCNSSSVCGISGVIYSSDFACQQSIASYHVFLTNNSTITNSITVRDILPPGFIFLQDTIEFDAGGFSDFKDQPSEGDDKEIKWGKLTLQGGETVKISYDVILDENAELGLQSNAITLEMENEGTVFTSSILSAEIEVGSCPVPNTYTCEPAFYQVYKQKGKNQPNVYGKLDPGSGEYSTIAIASDFANGLGFDINTGLVYGASGKRFIQLDEDGFVLDQGISFTNNVFRGDINQSSEWYGVDGVNMVKIDVSGTPIMVATYPGQALPGWDMAYNLDGDFYSIHNRSLYKFNTKTNTKSFVGTISGNDIPENGGYGAQWTGSDGYLYASHNQSGKILRVNIELGQARVVSYSKAGLSKNDGFSCPTEIPVISQFDYGDNSHLPQSRILAYRQDLSDDGVPDFSTVWIGNTIDYDLLDPSNAKATADSDDGFILGTEIENGLLSSALSLNVNFETTVYYLTGIDWNDDGTFDEILQNSIPLSGPETVIGTLEVPDGIQEGFINIRVLASEKPLQKTNISGDILAMGEVEDYRFYISSPCTGPDCEISSGVNGGLESNGDLAQAIARRSYARKKNNNKKHLKAFQQDFKSFISARTLNSTRLSTFFPSTGATGDEDALVSSPEDLTELTNASEVFALDYYLLDQRVAASLLLVTEDKVYNHSKNVCERLNGKSLEDVQLINLDGVSVIYAKITNENGAAEYSAWFSAMEKDNNYEVFSRWNVDEYPEGKYLNFQAWSSSPGQVFHILKYVLGQLNEEKTLTSTHSIQQIPGVIVKSGEYKQGTIQLSLINKNKANSTDVNINLRRSEGHHQERATYRITLSGEYEENISLPIGNLFDAGISVHTEAESAYDALYLADGAWGTDFNSWLSEITQFEILEESRNMNDEEYHVERGFQINGISSDVVNVFRNLKAGEKTLSIDDYTLLSFDMQNDHPVEISLIENNLTDWNNRLRYTIPVNREKTKNIIWFKDFEMKENQEDIKIRTIVFSYLNNSGEAEPFSFGAKNLAFGREALVTSLTERFEQPKLSVYPNPVRDQATIAFNSSSGGNYTINVIDLDGRIMRSFMGQSSIGINRVKLSRSNIKQGLSIIELRDASGLVMRSKVLFE